MSEEKKEEKIEETKVEETEAPKPEAEAPKQEEKPEPSAKEKELSKQIDELKTKLQDANAKYEEADKNADMWKNKYYQVYADMANTRKMVEKETADFKKYAQKSLIEELIPALDVFDMALKNEPDDEKLKKYLQGFKMTHGKLIEVLKQHNVVIIDPKKGDDYDPNTMQAYSTVEGEEDNKIADVFTKGYQLEGHLLRAAGVIVTQKKQEDTSIEIKDGKAENKEEPKEEKNAEEAK